MGQEVLATAGAVKIVITGEGAQFSAVVADAQRQLDKLGSKAASTGRAVSHTVPQFAAASGAIRLLEGGINNNVRAAERFLSTTLRLGPALQMAFPVVGAIAFGAVIGRLVNEVAEFGEKMRNAARDAEQTWRGVQAPMTATNDALRVTNDRLEQQIAKLEGKPFNGLKLAIDEAIKSADELGTKLDDDLGKIGATLKAQQPGFAGRFLNPFSNDFKQAGTADLSRHAQDVQDRLAEMDVQERQQLEQMRSAGASQSQIAAASANFAHQRMQALREAMDWAEQELRTARAKKSDQASLAAQTGARAGLQPLPISASTQQMFSMDPGERIRLLTHYLDNLGSARDFIGFDQADQNLSGRKDVDQAKKDAVERSKQASTAALQQARTRLEGMKAIRVMSLQDEEGYWQKIADSAKRGSELYNGALEEANKARAAILKKDQADWGATVLEMVRADDQVQSMEEKITEAVNSFGVELMKQDRDAAKESLRKAQEAFRNATQAEKDAEVLQEEAIRAGISSGALSEEQGARLLQALHQESFASWSARARAFSQQFPDAGVPGASQAMRGFGVQSEKDAAAVKSAQALGALSDAAQQMAQQFTDLPTQIQNFFAQTVSGFNELVVRSMMGDRSVNWGQLGAGMVGSVANAGLQYVEGSAMKALFGINPGAKMGTQANPMWIRNVDMTGTVASSAGSVLSSLAGSSGSGSSSGGTWSKVISTALSFLPGFAAGGAISAHMPAMVGESGPELFVPHTSGRIVPNSALHGGGPTIHVDARGAGDPAAVEAAVHRAMGGYLAMAPALAVAAVRDHNARMPMQHKTGM